MNDDIFKERCKLAHKIAIVGYGNRGKHLYKWITQHHIGNEVLVFDNFLENVPSLPHIQKVENLEAEVGLLAVLTPESEKYKEQLINQLGDKNFPMENVIQDFPDSLIDSMKLERLARYGQATTLETFKFEVNIVKHCNLNCAYCSHFSPIAEKEFMDIHIFYKDMTRLSELLHQQAMRILLLGGEPLLHPKITSFLQISRELFPMSQIEIITNGLLLLSMPATFFSACRKFDIVISPTQYPIPLDYQAIGDYVQQQGVRYALLGENARYMRWEDRDKSFGKYPLDLYGNQLPEESYRQCPASQCITLDAGKLFPCSTLPNIYLFNRYYDKRLPVTTEDYINIYDNIDAEEIVKNISRPVSFCKYCAISKAEQHEWKKSRKDIQEWTL